jgi:hypothetical protein
MSVYCNKRQATPYLTLRSSSAKIPIPNPAIPFLVNLSLKNIPDATAENITVPPLTDGN